MDIEFQQKFKDSYNKILTLGEDYAVKKGKSWQMQELKHSIMASIINRYPELPVSKAEIQSRASVEYQDYIKGTSQAITEELSAKAKYEAEKARFEALRSLSSLEKIIIRQTE